jgi:hypothetical protein
MLSSGLKERACGISTVAASARLARKYSPRQASGQPRRGKRIRIAEPPLPGCSRSGPTSSGTRARLDATVFWESFAARCEPSDGAVWAATGPTTSPGTSSCYASTDGSWRRSNHDRSSRSSRSALAPKCGHPEKAACGVELPLRGGRLFLAPRAETHLLGKLRAGGRIVGRDHRVIVRQAPLFAVFLG